MTLGGSLVPAQQKPGGLNHVGEPPPTVAADFSFFQCAPQAHPVGAFTFFLEGGRRNVIRPNVYFDKPPQPVFMWHAPISYPYYYSLGNNGWIVGVGMTAISGGLLSAVMSIRYILGFRKDNPNVFNGLIQNWPHF
jgi:hypothetical protein